MSVGTDLANRWPDMVLLYRIASYRSREGLWFTLPIKDNHPKGDPTIQDDKGNPCLFQGPNTLLLLKSYVFDAVKGPIFNVCSMMWWRSNNMHNLPISANTGARLVENSIFILKTNKISLSEE